MSVVLKLPHKKLWKPLVLFLIFLQHTTKSVLATGEISLKVPEAAKSVMTAAQDTVPHLPLDSKRTFDFVLQVFDGIGFILPGLVKNYMLQFSLTRVNQDLYKL
ncbi:hypothetical protein BD770DRAFT_379847 [Pilaira anomala]|nr:hypothetical protein BD770DRAFT_379847 [Pilaira anomala]